MGEGGGGGKCLGMEGQELLKNKINWEISLAILYSMSAKRA